MIIVLFIDLGLYCMHVDLSLEEGFPLPVPLQQIRDETRVSLSFLFNLICCDLCHVISHLVPIMTN